MVALWGRKAAVGTTTPMKKCHSQPARHGMKPELQHKKWGIGDGGGGRRCVRKVCGGAKGWGVCVKWVQCLVLSCSAWEGRTENHACPRANVCLPKPVSSHAKKEWGRGNEGREEKATAHQNKAKCHVMHIPLSGLFPTEQKVRATLETVPVSCMSQHHAHAQSPFCHACLSHFSWWGSSVLFPSFLSQTATQPTYPCHMPVSKIKLQNQLNKEKSPIKFINQTPYCHHPSP